jgi:hypothetical protein
MNRKQSLLARTEIAYVHCTCVTSSTRIQNGPSLTGAAESVMQMKEFSTQLDDAQVQMSGRRPWYYFSRSRLGWPMLTRLLLDGLATSST